jgi:hypothetical protein
MAIETHGNQPGAAYNGYYSNTIYYPLVAGFAPYGDYDSVRLGDGFVHAILRKGNAFSAGGALRFIRTAYRKCKRWAKRIDVRMDAAFTIGEIRDPLNEDGIRFVGRLKTNKVLERMVRVPGQGAHRFRTIPPTHSDRRRPSIPNDFAHLFRSIPPAPFWGVRRH